MRRTIKEITAEQLKAILKYNPETGLFTWLVNRRPRGKAGHIAGYQMSNGYILIGISGGLYLAHRLAHLYMTGEWPKELMDHINGKPGDNRWCNIRPCSEIQNRFNVRRRKNNKCGTKGVHKRKDCNRWAAFIGRNKKNIYLGLFKTKKEATAAYRAAAVNLHGEFARFS